MQGIQESLEADWVKMNEELPLLAVYADDADQTMEPWSRRFVPEDCEVR